MSSSSTDKQALIHKLAELLGFDDGAEDVLEHLLSIESSQDLLDYLSQLLGQDGDTVKTFVENVGRFQRGESVDDGSAAAVTEQSNEPATASQRQENYMDATTTTKGTGLSKSPPRSGNKNQQKGAKAVKKPAAAAAATKSQANNSTAKAPIDNKQTNKQQQSVKKPANKKPAPKPPPKKSQPPKGQRLTAACGCFGSVHKPLTNCLFCGRISCIKEGYDFCPHCAILVEPIEGGDEIPAQDKAAWLHKERLLRFDRDFAHRTVVLDAQQDYYVNSSTSKAWLTKDEQAKAQEQQEKRDKDMHQRKHQTLNISF